MNVADSAAGGQAALVPNIIKAKSTAVMNMLTTGAASGNWRLFWDCAWEACRV
jgi:hypothetical protein